MAKGNRTKGRKQKVKYEMVKMSDLNTSLAKLEEFKFAIQLVSKGMSVPEACKQAGLDQDTFYNIKNYDPELQKVYYEALKRRTDTDIEKVRNDVLNCNKDTAFPAKIKTEFVKWIGAKLNPNVYGDVDNKPPVNLEIKIGGELVTVKGGNKK